MKTMVLDGEWLEIGQFYFKLNGIDGWQFIPDIDCNGKKIGDTIVLYNGHKMQVHDNKKNLCNFLAEHFKSKNPTVEDKGKI